MSDAALLSRDRTGTATIAGRSYTLRWWSVMPDLIEVRVLDDGVDVGRLHLAKDLGATIEDRAGPWRGDGEVHGVSYALAGEPTAVGLQLLISAAVETPSVSTFADAYRQIVTPRLERACCHHDLLVALGVETYTEAHTAVACQAQQLGASHLPTHLYDELLDWIGTRLLRGIDQYAPTIAAADRRAAAVAASYDAWEAAHCPTTILP